MENKKVSVWKQCKPYMAGLQLPLLIAVVAAVISSIITVYGPTKIKEITNLISDGLATEIDLVAVSNIAGFLVVLYVFGAILNYTQLVKKLLLTKLFLLVVKTLLSELHLLLELL